MPKRPVRKRFRDKYTKKVIEADKIYEHSDPARIEELTKEGYLYPPKSESVEYDEPKHVGGGYYELPNGEKVKGKKQALAAMKD